MERIRDERKPTTAFRIFAKMPNFLYRIHAGWLLGQRFLMMLHVGRKSGRTYRTVVEVVRRDREADVYYVVSGFGERAQWYKNVMAQPDIEIHVGGRRHLPRHVRRLEQGAAEEELLDYQRRHPKTFDRLAGVMGFSIDGSEADTRELARITPVLAFEPRAEGD